MNRPASIIDTDIDLGISFVDFNQTFRTTSKTVAFMRLTIFLIALFGRFFSQFLYSFFILRSEMGIF